MIKLPGGSSSRGHVIVLYHDGRMCGFQRAWTSHGTTTGPTAAAKVAHSVMLLRLEAACSKTELSSSQVDQPCLCVSVRVAASER